MKRALNALKNKTAFLLAIIVAAVVGGAATAAVSAAIPDSGGQINACYKNSTKVLSVTDPAGSCANNETALSWAQNSGKIISNHTTVPFGNSSEQQVLNIPNLGSVSILTCINSSSDIHYLNNTSHDVLTNSGVIPPGDPSNPNSFATYTSGGTTYFANVQAVTWIDESAGVCHSFAQATISQY